MTCVERANWALAPRPPGSSQPQSIVIKLLSFRMKEEVIRLAWQKKGFMWENHKIYLNHDYALDILARRREYVEVRRALREKNTRFQTLFLARLRVVFEEETLTYKCAEGTTADLAAQGFPVKVIPQLKTLLERIQQRLWQRTPRSARADRMPGYKEKLQAFQHTLDPRE